MGHPVWITRGYPAIPKGVKDACFRYSSTIPGLLPWQVYVLAFVVGIFGIRFPIPAVTALTVLWLADRNLRERACRLPVLAFICCAVFGFGYGSQRTPELPSAIPAWMETRSFVEVRAVVDGVEPRSGHRLRVMLRDVRCQVEGAEEILPGRV